MSSYVILVLANFFKGVLESYRNAVLASRGRVDAYIREMASMWPHVLVHMPRTALSVA